MNHFERITTQSSEPFGLPTIRDTGITVSDVVRPIVSGEKSVQAVLDAYPTLELEDVHQALAFAVSDLTLQLSQVDHDVTDSLTPVRTYSKGMNTPQLKEHFLKTLGLEKIFDLIFRQSTNARSYMLISLTWARLSYTQWLWQDEIKKFTLHELIEQIKHQFEYEHWREYAPISYAIDEVPESVKVGISYSSIVGIRDLCVCMLRPTGIKKLSSQFFADYDVSGNRLYITINHVYSQDSIFSPLSDYKKYFVPEFAHIGKLILSQNQIEVHAIVADHTITFTFDLPIADAE
ncbi:MAG: DUF433 domain-containing protein [Aggregatilineales bacterium]